MKEHCVNLSQVAFFATPNDTMQMVKASDKTCIVLIGVYFFRFRKSFSFVLLVVDGLATVGTCFLRAVLIRF